MFSPVIRYRSVFDNCPQVIEKGATKYGLVAPCIRVLS